MKTRGMNEVQTTSEFGIHNNFLFVVVVVAVVVRVCCCCRRRCHHHHLGRRHNSDEFSCDSSVLPDQLHMGIEDIYMVFHQNVFS